MANMHFLRLPGIAGESRAEAHEDEIDLLRLDWSVEQPQGAILGSGRRRARAVVSPLTVEKFYDASSPYLALAAMAGTSFEEAVISVRKDSGDAHADYLIITLSNVVISAYATANREDRGALYEEAALSFEAIKLRYVVQSDDHSSGDEHEIEFDIAAGI